MLLDGAEPGPKPLDLLPHCGDPLVEQPVLTLEEADPLARLLQLGAAGPSLPAPLPNLLLRLETARPPAGELFLDQREQPLQALQLGCVRPFVG